MVRHLTCHICLRPRSRLRWAGHPPPSANQGRIAQDALSADLVGSPVGWYYRAGGGEPGVWRVGIPGDQPGLDPASFGYAAVNGVAGQAASRFWAADAGGGSTGSHRLWLVRDGPPEDAAMATVVPEHGGGGWSSEARASMRLRSPAPLRYPGASWCSSSDAGGEASLLSRRGFMGSVRMCRSRAGLDPVFRVVMFVINGACPSSFPGCPSRQPGGQGGEEGWRCAGGRRR
jgi:hypothetical protein